MVAGVALVDLAAGGVQVEHHGPGVVGLRQLRAVGGGGYLVRGKDRGGVDGSFVLSPCGDVGRAHRGRGRRRGERDVVDDRGGRRAGDLVLRTGRQGGPLYGQQHAVRGTRHSGDLAVVERPRQLSRRREGADATCGIVGVRGLESGADPRVPHLPQTALFVIGVAGDADRGGIGGAGFGGPYLELGNLACDVAQGTGGGGGGGRVDEIQDLAAAGRRGGLTGRGRDRARGTDDALGAADPLAVDGDGFGDHEAFPAVDTGLDRAGQLPGRGVGGSLLEGGHRAVVFPQGEGRRETAGQGEFFEAGLGDPAVLGLVGREVHGRAVGRDEVERGVGGLLDVRVPRVHLGSGGAGDPLLAEDRSLARLLAPLVRHTRGGRTAHRQAQHLGVRGPERVVTVEQVHRARAHLGASGTVRVAVNHHREWLRTASRAVRPGEVGLELNASVGVDGAGGVPGQGGVLAVRQRDRPRGECPAVLEDIRHRDSRPGVGVGTAPGEGDGVVLACFRLGEKRQPARGALTLAGLDEAAGPGVEGVLQGLGLVVRLVDLPYLEGVGAVLGRGDADALGRGGAAGGHLGPRQAVQGPFEPVVIVAPGRDREGAGLSGTLDPRGGRVVRRRHTGRGRGGGGVDREGLPLRPARVVMRPVVRRGAELVRLAVGQDSGRDGHGSDLSGVHPGRDDDVADLGVGGGVEDLEGAVDLVPVGVDEGVPQGRGGGVDHIGAAVGVERRTRLLLRARAWPVVVRDGQLRRVRGCVGGVDTFPLPGDSLVGGTQTHV